MSAAVAPCAQNGVRIFAAAETAVEARQRAVKVAVFQIIVVAQDGAAVAQVGADVEKIMRRFADIVFPKRHDLHQAARADAADGVLPERALHFDESEYNLGVQPGAAGFILDVDQQAAAFAFVGHISCQTGRHCRKPAFAFLRGSEHQPRRIDVVNRTAHHRSDVVRQGFFALRAGQRQRRR